MDSLENVARHNIIDLIHWDVSFALDNLRQQINKQGVKWLFVHSDRELFDVSSFTNHLETVEIINFARIKLIYEKANAIINLHNGIFVELVNSTPPEETSIIDPGGESYNISMPFQCIKLNGKQKTHVNPAGYQRFFFPIKPKLFHSNIFAYRCDEIMHIITAFYPEFSDMNFYEDTVNDIYLKSTDIDGTHFSDPLAFLEEKHLIAKFKGKVFYENIINELVKHWRAKTPLRVGEHFSDDCTLIVNYCKGKIAEVSTVESGSIEKGISDIYFEEIDINDTIADLTEANLEKHGFDKDDINNFFDPDIPPYEHTITSPKGVVFASAKEGKIYSGLAGARKVYFKCTNIQLPYKYPQLLKEYYEIKLAIHLEEKKSLLGPMYFENSEVAIFIDNEINWVKKEIEANQLQKETYKFNYQLPLIKSNQTNIKILQSYSAFLSKSKTEGEQQKTAIGKTPKLSLRQIALICHYTGETVTRINGNEIAKKFNQNSGDGIFNHFTYYHSRANRIGVEKTDKKNSNKRKLFESLLQYFDNNDTFRTKVLEDFNTFKAAAKD